MSMGFWMRDRSEGSGPAWLTSAPACPEEEAVWRRIASSRRAEWRWMGAEAAAGLVERV